MINKSVLCNMKNIVSNIRTNMADIYVVHFNWWWWWWRKEITVEDNWHCFGGDLDNLSYSWNHLPPTTIVGPLVPHSILKQGLDNDLVQIFVDLFGQLLIMELEIVNEGTQDILHFVNVFDVQILKDLVFEIEW